MQRNASSLKLIVEISKNSFPSRRRTSLESWWSYAPLVIALGLRLFSESTANLSYLVIAAYALFGHSHAIRALMLSWLFTMFNPGIAPEATAASVGRFVVLFAAASGILTQSNFFRSGARVFQVTFWTILLGVFLFLHSLAFSFIVDVSILKTASWVLAMTSVLSAWLGLAPSERPIVSNDVFLGLTLVALVSLPLAGLPVGYLTNGTGFQGILNQPQAFGATMALLGAWASARILNENRPSWWLFGVAGLSIGLILMSETRTAGFALALGLITSLLFFLMFTSKSMRRVTPGLYSRRFRILLGIVLVGGVILAPKVASITTQFITKSDRADVGGLLEAYITSRGILINPMLDNISETPLTGIGFGIASRPAEMVVLRDPVLGLPVGAAVEKGVAPLMILEEVGIVGLVPVSLWLLMIVRRSARAGFLALTVCLTILFLNMGEASLFAPGGAGLLSIIMLSWAATGLPDSFRSSLDVHPNDDGIQRAIASDMR